MDPITVDTLARTLAARGTRRQLVTLLAALPLAGVLTGLPADNVTAELPPARLQRRTAQRTRKQRNTGKNNNNGNGGGNNNNNNNNKNKNNQGGDLGGYPNKCGNMVCPADKPLCCAVEYNGNLDLECLSGTTCPPIPA